MEDQSKGPSRMLRMEYWCHKVESKILFPCALYKLPDATIQMAARVPYSTEQKMDQCNAGSIPTCVGQHLQHAKMEPTHNDSAANMQSQPSAHSKSLGYKFASSLKETLFPDDPFRQFKNQKSHRKCFMALEYMFPILGWGSRYSLTDLKADIISGLTIASLSIPQGIAYAKLANLTPLVGLYSCFVPPLMYAIFGTSRHIAAGPSAILSLVLGSMLQAFVDPVANRALYLYLAFTATFFAGVFQTTLGVFRLGFLVDYMSHATVLGFISGVALVICCEQLNEVLGLKHFTKKTDLVSIMKVVFERHRDWSWAPILIAICFITFLLFTKYMSKRKKFFFWISAAAPMISVVVTTFFVWITKADERGLRVIGHLNEGINPLSIEKLVLKGEYVGKVVKIGAVIAFIALMEAVAVGRTFASAFGYHIDGNKEMIAVGIMNVVGSCTSCYPTTGGLCRSAVNTSAGCRTAASNIVMATVIMVALLALLPLFHYTPNVTLSAIIFSAVVGLIDPAGAYAIWNVDKVDFLAYLGGFLGVIFISVEMGLVIAMLISLLRILLQLSRPHTSLMGQIPNSDVFRNIKQYSEACKIPGIAVIRIDASIYFPNANYVRERVIRWVEDEDYENVPVRFVILDLSPVMAIDTTAIHALEDTHKNLKSKGVQLAIANPGNGVLMKLHKSGFVEHMGHDWFFVTVAQAVKACLKQAQAGSNEEIV